MPDLLVRLYDLPPAAPAVQALAAQGIEVRAALPLERPVVTAFARAHASEGWAAECEAAFARLPVGCIVAIARGPGAAPVVAPAAGYGTGATGTLIGFACVEASCRDFFGPELVHPDWRGRGVGRALLLVALEAMRAAGYAYAIIGWASTVEFYRRAVGATVIDGSEPGIYRGPLLRG